MIQNHQETADCAFVMKKTHLFYFAILCIFILTGCESSSNNPAQADASSFQTGIASWYGEKYHGRTTASGETFDKNALTAAHRTLDFGTWVQVTNLDNGRRVTVKINDRGPFVEGRIIDLSERAASDLGMINAGLAQVSLAIVSGP